MENLKFEYEGQFITFSELDGENELRIDTENGYGSAVQYLCIEQVIALKDYLIRQLNNLPNKPRTVSNNESLKKVNKPERCNIEGDCYNSLGVCIERHCNLWFMSD